MNIEISVKIWDFYPPYSCSLLTWVVIFWILVPLCSRRSQMRYWQKYYGFLMKLSLSLWWTAMRYESIVSDGKLWSRSGWMFFNAYSEVLFLFTSSTMSSYSSYSLICSYCESIRWFSSFVFSIVLMKLYGSSKRA